MTPEQLNEFEALKRSHEKLNTTLENVFDLVNATTGKMERILRILIGDEMLNDGGMVKRLHNTVVLVETLKAETDIKIQALHNKIEIHKTEYDKENQVVKNRLQNFITQVRTAYITGMIAGGILGYMLNTLIALLKK
jgi:hypothetical protein